MSLIGKGVSIPASGGGGSDLDAFFDGSLTSLTSNATVIRPWTCYNYTTLLSASFPLAETIGDAAFCGCVSLASINFPSAKTVGQEAFRNAYFTTADFPSVESIKNYAFRNVQPFTVLILRKNAVVNLQSNLAFSDTTFLTGRRGNGKVYVPQSLISSYQSGTGWQNLSYVDFLPIEGSIYEET